MTADWTSLEAAVDGLKSAIDRLEATAERFRVFCETGARQ